MRKEKRHFDLAFKVMAVELWLPGKPTGEVAQELGIRVDLLSRWKRGGGRPSTNKREKGAFRGMASLL